MKKFFGKHPIILLIIMLFITLFFVPICIKFVSEIPAPFPFLEIITSDTYEAWIGYCGAIIGGALTLVGVWWTIKFESEQLKERIELEKMTKYFPTISARVVKSQQVNDLCSSVNVEIDSELFKVGTEDYGDCLISLCNVGQSEAYIDGIELDSFIINYINPNLGVTKDKLTPYFIGDGNFKFLPARENFYIKIGYTKLNSILNSYIELNQGTILFQSRYGFIINVGGVLTGDDPFQYFLTFDVDIYYARERYTYKIYNVSLVR